MTDKDKLMESKIEKWLGKAKTYHTSLDFNARLMKRIEILHQIRKERQRYYRRAIIMVGVSIVLGLIITFFLSGLNNLFSDNAALNEIIQIFLLSIVLILGGLILYVTNSLGEVRRNSMARV